MLLLLAIVREERLDFRSFTGLEEEAAVALVDAGITVVAGVGVATTGVALCGVEVLIADESDCF
jgi:hypothetical protein